MTTNALLIVLQKITLMTMIETTSAIQTSIVVPMNNINSALPYIYWIQSGCPPEMCNDNLTLAYSSGDFEGRILFFEREVDIQWYMNLKEKGFNTIVGNYFTTKRIESFLPIFKQFIADKGGKTSHLGILAREGLIKYAVIPGINQRVFFGDYLKIKKNKVLREEAEFFVPYPTPKNKKPVFYLTEELKKLGLDVGIIEIVPGFYGLDIRPSEFYNMLKDYVR